MFGRWLARGSKAVGRETRYKAARIVMTMTIHDSEGENPSNEEIQKVIRSFFKARFGDTIEIESIDIKDA